MTVGATFLMVRGARERRNRGRRQSAATRGTTKVQGWDDKARERAGLSPLSIPSLLCFQPTALSFWRSQKALRQCFVGWLAYPQPLDPPRHSRSPPAWPRLARLSMGATISNFRGPPDFSGCDRRAARARAAQSDASSPAVLRPTTPSMAQLKRGTFSVTPGSEVRPRR